MQRPEYFTNLRLLALVAMADGKPRHAYGLIDELITITGWRPSASTVIDSLTRLHRDGLIEPVPGSGRQKPYRITDAGRDELDSQLALLHRLTRLGRQGIKDWRHAQKLTGDLPSRERPRVDADVEEALEKLVVKKAEHDDVPKAKVIRDALRNHLEGTRSPQRATCPHCGRSQRLTTTGKWYAHNDPATGRRCSNSGKLPRPQLRKSGR